MSSKKKSFDDPADPADPADFAAAASEPFDVREVGGLLVYSAGGVDLLSRKPGAGSYTLLADHPPTGARAGEVKQLCEPFDEQCACTARELASSLGGA